MKGQGIFSLAAIPSSKMHACETPCGCGSLDDQAKLFRLFFTTKEKHSTSFRVCFPGSRWKLRHKLGANSELRAKYRTPGTAGLHLNKAQLEVAACLDSCIV